MTMPKTGTPSKVITRRKQRVTIMLPAELNQKVELFCAAQTGHRLKKNEVAARALMDFLKKHQARKLVAHAMGD